MSFYGTFSLTIINEVKEDRVKENLGSISLKVGGMNCLLTRTVPLVLDGRRFTYQLNVRGE